MRASVMPEVEPWWVGAELLLRILTQRLVRSATFSPGSTHWNGDWSGSQKTACVCARVGQWVKSFLCQSLSLSQYGKSVICEINC